MTERLGLSINVALGALVVAAGVWRVGGWTPAPASPEFTINRAAPGRDAVDFSRSPKTVLLVLRSDCRFCTASMDLYRRIAADGRRGDRVRLVVGGPEPVPVLTRYLETHGLLADQIVTLPPDGIRGTPTLLIVGQTGTIEAAWVGKLDPLTEQDVMASLKVAPTSARDDRSGRQLRATRHAD